MLDKVIKAIDAAKATLEKAQALPDWRFHQGEATGAEQPGYDDSSWDLQQPGATWAGAAGEVWLRRTLQFDDRVAGIETRGSSVELPFIVPIHSEVFVDGELRRAEPSWLDTRAVPLIVREDYQPGQEIQIAIHAFGGDGFGLFMPSEARVSSLAEAIWDLDVIKGQIQFTHLMAFDSQDAATSGKPPGPRQPRRWTWARSMPGTGHRGRQAALRRWASSRRWQRPPRVMSRTSSGTRTST